MKNKNFFCRIESDQKERLVDLSNQLGFTITDYILHSILSNDFVILNNKDEDKIKYRLSNYFFNNSRQLIISLEKIERYIYEFNNIDLIQESLTFKKIVEDSLFIFDEGKKIERKIAQGCNEEFLKYKVRELKPDVIEYINEEYEEGLLSRWSDRTKEM